MRQDLFIIFFYLLVLIPIQTYSQERPKLKAVAEEVIKHPFVADEKNIRKLNEIITTRILEKTQDPYIKYVVTFIGHSYYDTRDFELILQEENPNTRMIISLEMQARDRPDYYTAFSQERPVPESMLEADTAQIKINLSSEGLGYSIKGTDRDWTLKTQSDILERFHNMIQQNYGVPYFLVALCSLSAMLVIYMPFAVIWRDRYDKRMKNDNQNHHKTPLLTFIFALPNPLLNFPAKAALTVIGIGLAGSVGYVAYLIASYLYPDAIFEIGNQISTYAAIKKYREYVIWTVSIGFIISVLGSYVATSIRHDR